MTAEHFRIVKHVTATLFAVAMAGLFVLGVDGLVGAMQKLTHLATSAPPTPTAEMPAVEPSETPGVVTTIIVPPDDAATDTSAGRGLD